MPGLQKRTCKRCGKKAWMDYDDNQCQACIERRENLEMNNEAEEDFRRKWHESFDGLRRIPPGK